MQQQNRGRLRKELTTLPIPTIMLSNRLIHAPVEPSPSPNWGYTKMSIHAWMMETGEFLDVTIANMGEEDYAWIDIFVYPQFSEGDGSTGAWIKRFDNMIVGIGKVVSWHTSALCSAVG